jgi:hypothetical protein
LYVELRCLESVRAEITSIRINEGWVFVRDEYPAFLLQIAHNGLMLLCRGQAAL